MANELIKYSYSTGELSPQFFGRSDLEQYDLGLAKAENWFVDFRGGLSNRPGLRYHEFLAETDLPNKFFNFRFSGDIEDQYLLIFGDHYIRFMQEGGYVLENDTESVVSISAGEVEVADASVFSVGDWFKIVDSQGLTNVEGRAFIIDSIDIPTNTLSVSLAPDGQPFIPLGTLVTARVARIYTVETVYDAEDLALLRAYQQRDLTRLTHPNYPIYNLIRNGHTDWEFELENIGNTRSPPTGLSATESAAGDASLVWAVSAVLANGEETRTSQPRAKTGIVNYSVVEGHVDFRWDRRAGAVSYNVYRSAIVDDSGADITVGVPLGFIGNVKGTNLLDGNIVPDFTKTPVVDYNPFAPGAITYIGVTASGTGHDDSSTVSVSGGGSQFAGYPVVFNGGVTGVVITRGGKDYVNPTVSFGGPGSGATATAEARSLEGNNPRVSTIFQQRQLYAGTDQFPLTIWGSRPKLYSNFNFSEISNEADAYEFEIDSAELSPILHLEPQRGGLLVMSNNGIWQLTGGNDAAVTASNVLADPQTYTGVSEVKPLRVDNNLIYVESRGYGVRILSYNEFSKVYSSDDKSILSRHLFGRDKQIIDWCAATDPLKLVNCVLSNGTMLAFTIVAEEKIFAWTPWVTKGLFECCAKVQETQDRVYCAVKRYIDGRWVKTIESFADRSFETIEDAFFLDCGLSLTPSYQNTAAILEGTTLTTGVSWFPVDCEDWIIRCRGGKLRITERVSSTEVEVQIIYEIPSLVEGAPNELRVDEWTMDEPVTQVSGLWHLEGETVSALVDGAVVTGLVVTDGAVTLPLAGSRIHIGIPYQATALTLPPVVSDAVIENKRKRIIAVAARKYETVGLTCGPSLSKLRAWKERNMEPYNEAIRPFTGLDPLWIDPVWNTEGQTYFVQANPLPATLLGNVVEIEIGDDKR